jgi:glycerol-1-phosphatase
LIFCFLGYAHRKDPVLNILEYFILTYTLDIGEIEGRIPHEFGADAVEIPGSRALLDQLETVGAKWAIVTSGTRPLVVGWLDVMKLAHPQNLVVAEDVQHGKPDPEGYQLGRSKLVLPGDANVLVLEDAPAGVRAGKAAGFSVIALATTHRVDQLKAAGADWIVKDMRSVTFEKWEQKTGEVSIKISDALAG